MEDTADEPARGEGRRSRAEEDRRRGRREVVTPWDRGASHSCAPRGPGRVVSRTESRHHAMAAPALTPRAAAREGVREGGSTEEGPERERPEQAAALAALILIAIAALTGGMFASGNTTPRLGIDLAGGTSITLEAKSGQESAINKTNMNTAVDIMNRRVNGLGVSEAEVQTQGDRNIIVNIPKGTNSKQAREQVGTTAKLYFRPSWRPRSPARRRGQPDAEPLQQLLPKATDRRRHGHRQGDLLQLATRRPPPPRRAVPSPTR